MKSLLTIALASALLSPAAALADTTTATTAAPSTQATATTAATAPATSANDSSAVAMTKHQNVKDTSFGHVANDDRQGFARIQEEARQLGATN